MNFRGKSKMASVKNMIFVSDDDRNEEVMLLAKKGDN
jgi:hypothetical protein